MRRTLRSLLLGFSWCIAASGCSSWQRTRSGTGTAPAITGEYPVRVTRAGARPIVLNAVVVKADSLIGEYGSQPKRVAIALSDVRLIEERRLSVVRTTGLVVTGLLIVSLVAGFSSSDGWD